MKSADIQDRARQGPGEPPATDSDLLDIKTEIAALEKREIQELQGEWRKLYRVEPPKRLSRDLLLRAIAHPPQRAVGVQRRMDLLVTGVDDQQRRRRP
jgi:hypothetical protein